MKSRYLVIPPSAQTNANGDNYPDIMRFPIKQLKLTRAVKQYRLRQVDIDRFDLTVYTEYGTPELDDIVLWYNKIASVHDLVPGQVIEYPDIEDLNLWLNEFRKGRRSI